MYDDDLKKVAAALGVHSDHLDVVLRDSRDRDKTQDTIGRIAEMLPEGDETVVEVRIRESLENVVDHAEADRFWTAVPPSPGLLARCLKASPGRGWVCDELRGLLKREPTEKEQELWIDAYRRRLFALVPIGERYQCGCGRTVPRISMTACPVCGLLRCGDCTESIDLDLRAIWVCKKCKEKVPEGWID